MDPSSDWENIDQYIASFPSEVQEKLCQLRDTIRAAGAGGADCPVPGGGKCGESAEEKIAHPAPEGVGVERSPKCTSAFSRWLSAFSSR